MKKNIKEEIKNNPIIISSAIISLIVSVIAIHLAITSLNSQTNVAEISLIPEKILMLEQTLIECNNTDNPYSLIDDEVRLHYNEILLEVHCA